MKYKKSSVNKRGIDIIISFLVCCVFFLQSCNLSDDGCVLIEEDHEWLFEDIDSLLFIKNNADTLIARFETNYGQSSYDYTMGIRNGDNNHYGFTNIYININESKSVRIRCWVPACETKIDITQINYQNDEIICIWKDYLVKDSISGIKYTVQNHQYENCFILKNKKDSLLNVLIYNKEYGVLRLETTENDVFELLPVD